MSAQHKNFAKAKGENARGRGLSREDWERLLAEYRLQPGKHAAVARALGMHQDTCKRYWLEGSPRTGRAFAAVPISEIVEREQLALRAELQLDREAAERATARKLGEIDALRARADVVAEKVTNVQIARALKGQVLELATMYQRVLDGVGGAAAEGLRKIFEGPKFLELCEERPDQALKHVRTLIKIGNELGEAAERAVKLERLLLGESTENKALAVQHTFESSDDALAAIERAHRAALRHQGVVIDTVAVAGALAGAEAAE